MPVYAAAPQASVVVAAAPQDQAWHDSWVHGEVVSTTSTTTESVLDMPEFQIQKHLRSPWFRGVSGLK